MYVYKKSDELLWTVGYYDPGCKWQPESDHDTQQEAREQVHYLNGGDAPVETFKDVAEAADRVVDAFSNHDGTICGTGGPRGAMALQALRDSLGRI